MNNHPIIWTGPKVAKNVVILAHGAGAPMDTDFMNFFAENISNDQTRVLRFEFPYMALRREGYTRRPPNPQKTLLASWRQIIQECRKSHSGEVYIGGKSMGGRMASMIADECKVDGLILLGYPYYAPGKQDKPRIEHLSNLKTKTLILQGERDPMGQKEIVETYQLSKTINTIWLKDGNHDLKPRVKLGLSHDDNLHRAALEISKFIQNTIKNKC